jgi:thymidylate synthase
MLTHNILYCKSETDPGTFDAEQKAQIQTYLGGEIQWIELDQFYSNQLDTFHLFVPDKEYILPFRRRLRQWTLIFSKIYITKRYTYQHYTLERVANTFDHTYLDLLLEIQRAPLRQSRNSMVRSLFCKHLSFDLTHGFPLLTTKRMFWKGILEEFLFFVRGETNTRVLEQKGIRIWSGNTSREFLDQTGLHRRLEKHLGPMYGYQWRHFNAEYDEQSGKPAEKGIDQLVDLINGIQADPNSRRHLMTDYNPCQAKQGVLYPCHSLILQFYVDHGQLSMFCYNRSSDVFLGLPFNIASSALLLSLVAHLTGLRAHQLHLSLGDCHLYECHGDAAEQQLHPWRLPWKAPRLRMDIERTGTVEQILDALRPEHFVLEDYQCHRAISAPMIA